MSKKPPKLLASAARICIDCSVGMEYGAASDTIARRQARRNATVHQLKSNWMPNCPLLPIVTALVCGCHRAEPSPLATPPLDADSAATVALAPSADVTPPELSTMIALEGVKFDLGAQLNSDDETETPKHSVTLAAYAIDATEVTVEAWDTCIRAGACTQISATSDLCNDGKTGREKHPINCVAFADTQAFCAWAKRRLPTEAEWEWAAKGEAKQRTVRINPDDNGRLWVPTSTYWHFPWGKQKPSPDRMNGCGAECKPLLRIIGMSNAPLTYAGRDPFETTAPVGSYPMGASAWGVLDLAGNVSEWVDDWYALYRVSGKRPQTGTERVVRGGAWAPDDQHLTWYDQRVTRRGHRKPETRDPRIGFRCAR
jgi:formylglycine-generating enzyme required for sulfatase activity